MLLTDCNVFIIEVVLLCGLYGLCSTLQTNFKESCWLVMQFLSTLQKLFNLTRQKTWKISSSKLQRNTFFISSSWYLNMQVVVVCKCQIVSALFTLGYPGNRFLKMHVALGYLLSSTHRIPFTSIVLGWCHKFKRYLKAPEHKNETTCMSRHHREKVKTMQWGFLGGNLCKSNRKNTHLGKSCQRSEMLSVYPETGQPVCRLKLVNPAVLLPFKQFAQLLSRKLETEQLPASRVKMNIFAVYWNTFICHICHVIHRCLIARSNASSSESWSHSETGMKRAEDEDFIALWLGVETLKLKAFILLIY